MTKRPTFADIFGCKKTEKQIELLREIGEEFEDLEQRLTNHEEGREENLYLDKQNAKAANRRIE